MRSKMQYCAIVRVCRTHFYNSNLSVQNCSTAAHPIISLVSSALSPSGSLVSSATDAHSMRLISSIASGSFGSIGLAIQSTTPQAINCFSKLESITLEQK